MRRFVFGSRVRLPHTLVALCSLLAVVNGCEKLVGTGDTVVTRGAAGAGPESAGNAGTAGMSEATDGGAAGTFADAGGSAGEVGSAGNAAIGVAASSAILAVISQLPRLLPW